METQFHIPVLLEEVVGLWIWKKEGVYVDCTLGTGGHTLEALRKTYKGCMIVGLDRDPKAIALSRERLKEYSQRLILVKERFSLVDTVLKRLGIETVDGFLLDLGISLLQLKDEERGFAFSVDGNLDMRMNGLGGASAADLINSLNERELERLFREYGEEKESKRIAKGIIEARKKIPITKTSQLAQIVADAKRIKSRRIHPATKVFMALRIAVNKELEELKMFLEKVPPLLNIGGRLVVISYHSLEDRIVKEYLKDRSGSQYRILTKKPVRPGQDEIKINPSSRSAKLRAAERI